MSEQNFFLAITLCRRYHTTEIVINHTPANGVVKLDNSILIKRCCASLTEDLIENGFSLSMTEYGLSVDKFN